MKKTLALILAMLVAFSMFSVAAVAADDLVSVKFVDGGKIVGSAQVAKGTIITPYVPENPVKEDTDTTKYTFIGWESSFDGEVYARNTIPAADYDVTYSAKYAEEKVTSGQSLLAFFASIFERINLIFQYFATIFNFDREAA